MVQSLVGTVALVTGASSGIGEATAVALAGQGSAVSLVARRTDRLDDLASRIRDGAGTAITIGADVTDEQQAGDAVERTVAELGRLDIVVNSAGIMLLGPVVGTPVEEWRRMVDVNLLGLLHTSHAALPHLLHAADDGPPRGRPGQHQLGRRTCGAQWQRRLQRHQARRRSVQ